ncbi:MAG: Dam family site-specific DNA-(adenine-N6)-methyltransferase [Deltaproteobacteria bacterium]
MEKDAFEEKCPPFLKWAGGKRWLISRHAIIFPDTFNRYIEPFLGSGAVFFKLQPKKAILSDINKELISTYIAIKEDWQKVLMKLEKHHKLFNKDYYYKIRQSKSENIYDKAARLIFLNRTCWNGLYRVNLKGEFNVPIGTKTDVLREEDNFEKVSKMLKNVTLRNSDFEVIINKAKANDLLFVDPPYTVLHDNNGFIKYNEQLFSWADQIRLKNCLKRAKDRGSIIIMANASHSSIRHLYEADFTITELQRHSIIAASSVKRKSCKELIITSYI